LGSGNGDARLGSAALGLAALGCVAIDVSARCTSAYILEAAARLRGESEYTADGSSWILIVLIFD